MSGKYLEWPFTEVVRLFVCWLVFTILINGSWGTTDEYDNDSKCVSKINNIGPLLSFY